MINLELKEFELRIADRDEFYDFYSLLLDSFIPEEIRSVENARAILDNPDFILYNITVQQRTVGYISAWRLNGITFIEHFVMRKSERGNGYGEMAIREICRLYESLVLECEPREDEMKKRRAAFYERCGFIENPIEYSQPSYREGYGEVPLMLMSYPSLLSDPSDTVKEIYKKVYGRNI
jgi:hypothetical protein